MPPFGCVCVLVERQGRFLLIERSKQMYALPGGFVRWREHPAQAAQREATEETGLLLHIGDVVCYSSKLSSSFDHMSTLTIIFTAEVVGGELRRSIEGQPCWVVEEELYRWLDSHDPDILASYQRYREQHTKSEVSAS